MGANGNRKQTLRTNIIQPYETGFLADQGHKDYNAVVGQELDKISTSTKHMFQGLDDLRTEVNARTKALDALHLTVNDQYNRVMLEIGGVKMQIGQGINIDGIVDADGNSLSGILQGIKTEVNTAKANIMVALGEISSAESRFDGEILKINTTLGETDASIQRITGTLYTANDGLVDKVAKAETDIVLGDQNVTNVLQAKITQLDQNTTASMSQLRTDFTTADNKVRQDLNQTITTVDGRVTSVDQKFTTSLTQSNNNITSLQGLTSSMNSNGTTVYQAQWGVKSSVNGLQGGVGFTNSGGSVNFVIDADKLKIGRQNQIEGNYPFSVEGGIVYARDLYIRNGNISGAIQSDGYNGSNTGWRIDKNGGFQITSNDAGGAGRSELTSRGLVVYDENGAVRVIVGRIS